MSDKLVEVASYTMPIEAELARGRLEAEGIHAILTGGGAGNVFLGIQGIGGQFRLQVAAGDAERAIIILLSHSDKEEENGPLPPDEDSLWLCPLCGDAVADGVTVCPACETPRPAPAKANAVAAVPRHNPASRDVQEEPTARPDKITSDTPTESVPAAVEDDLDLAPLDTFLGDDLVRRAFLTALFGPGAFLTALLVPVFLPLTLYSVWLLARLALFPGKVSPRMMPLLYWALFIDGLVCVFYLILFGRFLLVP